MQQSVKQLLRAGRTYLAGLPLTKAERSDLHDAVYELTLQRARLFSYIVLTINLLLFYLHDFGNYTAGRWAESGFFALGVIWRITFVAGTLAHLYLDARLRRQGSTIQRPHRILALVYVAFILVMGTSQAILVQLIVADISIYALSVLAVATLLHVPNRWTWIYYLTSLVVLVAGIYLVTTDPVVRMGLTTNATSIVIVAFVLERLTFRSQLRNLADALTIRRKNQEIEEAYAMAANELNEARAVQVALLPQENPHLQTVEVAAHSQPAAFVGGDYYDWATDRNGTLAFAIGDATGHGARAGAMVTATKALLASLLEEPDLTEVLRKASLALRRVNLPRLYMALAVGRLRDNVVEVAGAGMPDALVWRAATGSIDVLPLKGVPLGSPFSIPYRVVRIELAPGDTVVLMSDGLPERRNPQGVELGYDAVRPLVARHAGGTASDVVNRLVEGIATWAEGAPLHDDVTLMVLRFKSPVLGRRPCSSAAPRSHFNTSRCD